MAFCKPSNHTLATHDASGTAVQVVQLVIAGGLLRNPEALAAPTSHASFRQQNAVLAPVRLTSLSLTLVQLFERSREYRPSSGPHLSDLGRKPTVCPC